jgi:hypothetical protein
MWMISAATVSKGTIGNVDSELVLVLVLVLLLYRAWASAFLSASACVALTAATASASSRKNARTSYSLPGTLIVAQLAPQRRKYFTSWCSVSASVADISTSRSLGWAGKMCRTRSMRKSVCMSRSCTLGDGEMGIWEYGNMNGDMNYCKVVLSYL